MVEPLRHRQTKEAETDMFDLQPPRHISTLPVSTVRSMPQYVRSRGQSRSAELTLEATRLTHKRH